jgi:hypothetical protein
MYGKRDFKILDMLDIQVQDFTNVITQKQFSPWKCSIDSKAEAPKAITTSKLLLSLTANQALCQP